MGHARQMNVLSFIFPFLLLPTTGVICANPRRAEARKPAELLAVTYANELPDLDFNFLEQGYNMQVAAQKSIIAARDLEIADLQDRNARLTTVEAANALLLATRLAHRIRDLEDRNARLTTVEAANALLGGQARQNWRDKAALNTQIRALEAENASLQDQVHSHEEKETAFQELRNNIESTLQQLAGQKLPVQLIAQELIKDGKDKHAASLTTLAALHQILAAL